MNKVILMGRLTRDPEVRYSQSAEPVAVTRFSIAVDRRFKRDGEPTADFINCVAFGKTGEFTGKYFKKGMMISIVGSLRVSSWEDQNGQKRTSTDVVVEEQYFAESKASFEARQKSQPNAGYNDNSSYSAQAPTNSSQQSEPDGFYNVEESVDDDDLPF